MSVINGKVAEYWIKENRPENGVFRVYWTKDGGASVEDQGLGRRYEWYYKDGKRADGVSKAWWPNGNLKSEHTLKDGKLDGVTTHWYENGQKLKELTYKNGIKEGLFTMWYENGQKDFEGNYKDGIEIDYVKFDLQQKKQWYGGQRIDSLFVSGHRK